jgi:phospholipase C
MDDNEFPQGEKLGLDNETIYNIFPYEWKTTAEYLEQANISWNIYQPNAKLVIYTWNHLPCLSVPFIQSRR